MKPLPAGAAVAVGAVVVDAEVVAGAALPGGFAVFTVDVGRPGTTFADATEGTAVAATPALCMLSTGVVAVAAAVELGTFVTTFVAGAEALGTPWLEAGVAVATGLLVVVVPLNAATPPIAATTTVATAAGRIHPRRTGSGVFGFG